MKRVQSIMLFVFVLATMSKSQGEQISIARIEQMPNLPQPYFMRDWKSVAKGYDSLVFKTTAVGQYLPLSSLYSNTVNYPASQSFHLTSYVGSLNSGGEGINCLPAVIGAELVGLNKRNHNGIDWVAMCKEWFNTVPSENIYLNTPRASSGNDWWYETMPNVFFYQLYQLHSDIPEFQIQYTTVADRWLAAIKAMNGSATPWRLPNMDHRAWKFSTMTPNDVGVREPEAAGAIGWLLYQAFIRTGEKKYRIGAEWAMEFLNSLSLNPSYELQLAYGAITAARMNAELGTMYDLQKILAWCFDVGSLRSWGTTLGTWGTYDCYGLVGEVQQFQPSYAFLMNTLQHVATLAPIARYDDRYARALGKWILNAANAVRLFYPKFLPSENQNNQSWSTQYDPNSYIGYEALKQTEAGKSPFATGDAVKNGWSATNLALYGSSHVGYFAAVVETTNVPKVLQLDLLKTDFGHSPAYPTYLYFNPYDSAVAVSIDVGNSSCDVYDAVSNTFLKNNVSNETTISLPANSARVIVLCPAGGTVLYVDEKMLVNGVVVDYRSSQTVANHSPRIKSVASFRDTILTNQTTELFCTAEDRDNDSLFFAWQNAYGLISGSGSQVSWTAPETAGVYTILCTVTDKYNHSSTDSVKITVVQRINHKPIIKGIKATPRKMNLNTSSMITCNAYDEDGDTLTYVWYSTAGMINGTGTTVSWHSPVAEGNYWIYCSVTDGFGAVAKDSLAVVVRDFSKFVKGNLLAWYPFNGNANDGSGNNRHGTVINAQLTTDRNGIPNSAYYFDGATSSIHIPNDNGLNVQQAISINFWMKVGTFFNREQYPLSHGNWMNRWKISISNNRLRWTVKTSTGIKDLDSETPVVLDSVYNVTTVYNGSEMELYLNGELDAFVPFSGTLQTTTFDLTVGQVLPNDNNYNFKGVLDDIRIFDYGLSVDEIAQLSSRVTSVAKDGISFLPSSYTLSAFPNPFNSSTVIRLSLPKSTPVTVKIVDVLGREVSTLMNEISSAGVITVRWDAYAITSGVYFCIMKNPETMLIHKLILLK